MSLNDTESSSPKEPGVLQLGTQIPDEQVENIMHEIAKDHYHSMSSSVALDTSHRPVDPLIPSALLEIARDLTTYSSLTKRPAEYENLLEKAREQAELIINNSAYVEVRAVVSTFDDPHEACNTIRAWTIGLLLACSGALINQLFSLRQPSIYIDHIVAQLLAYPLGTGWANYFPSIINNPSKFTRKEHMLITVMANVSFDVGYSGYIVVVQLVPTFFNQQWARDFGYQITLSLSFQLIGYGLAGLSRNFLVYPAAAVWPRNLAMIALNNSFHTEENRVVHGWKVSQLRFFLYAFAGMFLYFWFPNYIAVFLSAFSWMSWIAPDNIKLAAITGSQSGLGFNPLPTFDWNVVITTTQPLISPFFATVNNFMGMLITFPIIVAIWFTNTWYSAYMPININKPYDRFGARYKVIKIVDENGLFNQAAYEAYSPLYLSAANAFIYGAYFAIYPATLVYAYLYHRHEIVRRFRSFLGRGERDLLPDAHNRLMSHYSEAPDWWFLTVLLFAILMGLVAILAYPTHANVGSLFMGLLLAIIFLVPIGIMYSVTNMPITLNVLAELIGGFLFPGNALAMNMFKSYGYVTTARALTFAQDLKLGHYVKIPPRVMFAAQTCATVVSTVAAMAILNWQVTGIQGVCTPDAQAKFYCPGTSNFFTASVIWGTLGPTRMYGKGGPYNILLYGFLIGAVLPLPFYFLANRFPKNEFIRGIHVPVLLYGTLNWAPYNLSHAWPAVPIAWYFQVYVRKRYLAWWEKYNYILSTAFDCGIAIAAVVTFFALQWPGVEIVWWGNTVGSEGADAYPGAALLEVPEIGYWGPGSGWN